ncbi:glycosyltransferase [Parapedobacter sp. GCM10030251]|uniref:glycosyltransferase n=1 Tax=Parapedobacter sp. GCM10030251 TaxID=3273419 RepID=UPI0036119BAB
MKAENLNNRKTQVVFITHYNAMNGANQSLLLLLKGIRKLIDIKMVYIYNQKEDEGLFKELIEEQIPVSGIHCSSLFYSTSPFKLLISFPGKLLKNLSSLRKIAKYIKQEKIDLVYSNSSVETLGVFVAKITGIKHIWHVREFGYDDYKLVHLGGKKVKRYFLKLSDSVIAISKSIERYLNLKNAIQVYNPVFDETELSSRKIININQRTSLPNRLGMVGIISETKNQKRGLEALKKLRDRGYNLSIEFWGEVASKEYYKALLTYIERYNLTEYVFFKNFEKDKSKIYSGIDILLMCSMNEAFGRVTIEAMTFGAIVIGFDNAGTAEIITNGKNGLLYNDNTTTLEDQIIYCINNPSRYQEMRIDAESFSKKFTVRQHVHSITNVILSVFGRR